jgi:hypothetical protein
MRRQGQVEYRNRYEEQVIPHFAGARPERQSDLEQKQRDSIRIVSSLRIKLLRLRNLAVAISPRFTHRSN